MANVWSEGITSYFFSDELTNYNNKFNDINVSKINKNKKNLIGILIILVSGSLLGKIIHSIVFLNFYVILGTLTNITRKCKSKLDYMKPAFIFLATVLLSEVIDIEFYKSLILFYTGISIVGINILEPIYNKKIIDDNLLKNKSNLILKIFSLIVVILGTAFLYMANLLEYILYVSNPIFSIYIIMIISIIKENIILD
ncbi:hypothetical protein EAI30_09160 [Romboutsia ilealis]|uniref:AgrB-like protein n=1 Tax=Romboutsia faecis TaxID=2764597 RepID=A0ABR7JRP4_9FIRM|nr:hypothetical protein [Romboutsia faecis]MBC5997585.1 hypothetical protein [Romboutsia faecis]MRN24782.1 hypothetical protein [Romboutsia ilealis]